MNTNQKNDCVYFNSHVTHTHFQELLIRMELILIRSELLICVIYRNSLPIYIFTYEFELILFSFEALYMQHIYGHIYGTVLEPPAGVFILLVHVLIIQRQARNEPYISRIYD